MCGDGGSERYFINEPGWVVQNMIFTILAMNQLTYLKEVPPR
jgi:hypothetical protein